MKRIKTCRALQWPAMLSIAVAVQIPCHPLQAQETQPVGKTKADQQRNAALLGGYEYGKYATALTGYTGQDRQRISLVQWQPAVRTRVGPRGNYKAGLAELPDGKLVLAACRSVEGKFQVHVYESADGGLNWQDIGQTPLFGKEPSLTALPDGSLVLTTQKLGKPFEMHVCRSSDGGRTWERDTLPGQDYPRNMIVQPDGSLLMVRALEFGWRGGGSPNLQICRSTDGGKTWQLSEGVVDWDYTAFGEISAIRLKDNRLLAALRRQIPNTHGEGFEDTVLTESSDDGAHWSKPRVMVNTAEVHVFLTELHDGRILATYSNYHLPWGVYAILSRDGGRTWDRDHPIQLALSADYYVGWPATLQLADQSLITSYALTAYVKQPPETTVTEVVRWRLPSDR